MAFLVSMLCHVTTLCPFPSSCNWRERRKNRGQICRYSSRGDGVGGPDRRVCSMSWHSLAAVASPIADADGGEVERNKCTLRLGTDSTSIPTRGKQSANFHSSAQDKIFISELFWPKFISVDICSILNLPAFQTATGCAGRFGPCSRYQTSYVKFQKRLGCENREFVPDESGTIPLPADQPFICPLGCVHLGETDPLTLASILYSSIQTFTIRPTTRPSRFWSAIRNKRTTRPRQ